MEMSPQEKNVDHGEQIKDLRLMYEESARMLRFFLNWRQLLFAGYFALLAALALSFKWSLDSAPMYAFVFPLIGFVMGVFFCLFDHRNRGLYRDISKIGSDIEERIGNGIEGYFTRYDRQKSYLRHTWLLYTLYLLSAAVMLIVAAVGIGRGYPDLT